jgi:hypothetical protein
MSGLEAKPKTPQPSNQPTAVVNAHATYQTLARLHGEAEAALVQRMQIAGAFAYWPSEVDGGPGVWETADVIRTLTWKTLTTKTQPSALARWMLHARNDDGGFPPWPDVSSRSSYVESTARCLLSLLRLEEAAPDLRPDLRQATIAAAKWLLECQDADDGGWRSAKGWTRRTSTTVWALLALGEMERLDVRDDETARRVALERGASWLRDTENVDGGFGLVPGMSSNLCSTSQVAWALGFRNEPITDLHQRKLISFLESGARDNVVDVIDDDPARRLFGRFELILLAYPLSVLGLMACRVDLRDPLTHGLLSEISGQVDDDHLWRIPDGRGVWPTHFYLWAIRTWMEVYRSYARAGLTFAHPPLPVPGDTRAAAIQNEGHVFVSHAAADKAFVRQLARIINAAGWETWLDERALVAGDDLVGGIGDGIKNAQAVVLVITDAFRGTERWMGHEVDLAVKRQIEDQRPLRIIPVVVGGAVDHIPEKVGHLLWKQADNEVDAIAFVLEALARRISLDDFSK